MKRLLSIAVLIAVGFIVDHLDGVAAAPEQPTFTRDIAPILHTRCASCHRTGEAAPMPLLTYEDARPWARSIKNKVVSRQMPPWLADPTIGTFANDPRLTDEQIDTVATWVDQGAPQGDPKDMPPLPTSTDGWQLGEPDQIIELPEVQIPATGRDYFPTPTITPDLKEDRWVRAIEIRPSAREVTHHSVIFATNAMALFGGDANGLIDVLGVWAVGTPPTVYPEGMGRWIRRGQALRTNLHYHPNGTAQTDRTRIGLYFGKGELKKEVVAAFAGNVTFSIPPGAPNFELRGVYVVDQDISVVSLFPHMHLRGKDMKMTATYPNGKQETLLNVPAYDFSWQLFYYPKTRLKLPKGTRVDLVAHFDNSTANKNNPDPTKAVTFGESSTSEMMFGMFEFTTDVGVSPRQSTPRSRLQALAATFPRESSFLIDLPFTTPPQPAVLYVPRTGDAAFYTQAAGVILPQPVPKLVWDGNFFQFNTLIRVLSGGGGFFTVTGTIAGDGTVRGKFERLAGRRGGPQPSYDYIGRHTP